MILPVFAHGWFAHTNKFVEVALQENLVVFIKDPEGAFQKVTTAEGIRQDTPIYLDLDMFLDFYVLAQHFDLMLHSRKSQGHDGTWLLVDTKDGAFKQR